MIAKKYQRKNEKWWIGQQVITIVEIRNGAITIPPGTICAVTRKYGGLALEVEACPFCGVKIHITRVGYEGLVLSSEVFFADLGCANDHARAMRDKTWDNYAVVGRESGYLVLPDITTCAGGRQEENWVKTFGTF